MGDRELEAFKELNLAELARAYGYEPDRPGSASGVFFRETIEGGTPNVVRFEQFMDMRD